ncbi:MAG: peptidoglycan-binding domain-containing protein [Desulfobacteraceae bacterium]
MVQYGERVIKKDHTGEDVVELQVRLAGFRGTLPDGIFGSGTELQVVSFQRDYMERDAPTGVVDVATMDAIDAFAAQYPINFEKLKCPCGECGGFGQGKFKGKYRSGKDRIEAFYRYEYPGIHRMLLWAVRGVFHYFPNYDFIITSGYRCSVHNKMKKRSSTNHHGKAIDLDVPRKAGEDKRDDMIRCDKIRGGLVELANAQIGWNANNRKALEPSNIAPTWVHYDVRSYQRKYLKEHFFCTDLETLDSPVRRTDASED